VPCGKVNSISEAFTSPLGRSLDLVHEVDGVKYVRSPIRYEGEQVEKRAPPKLNEHAGEILKGIGYS
jgi:crotonobetainyl-CoA:carnitine CoA-transferase CaiB-like acyl-CoA transferase